MVFDSLLPDVVHGAFVDGDQTPQLPLQVLLMGTFKPAYEAASVDCEHIEVEAFSHEVGMEG
jgi:hypothetical protein